MSFYVQFVHVCLHMDHMDHMHISRHAMVLQQHLPRCLARGGNPTTNAIQLQSAWVLLSSPAGVGPQSLRAALEVSPPELSVELCDLSTITGDITSKMWG